MSVITAQLSNILTLSRIVAAGVFMVVDSRYYVGIFIYACLSEFFDGFLARALKIESAFGKLMDPIADKTFILSVVVTLIFSGQLHVHELFLVGFRDLTVIAGALVVLAGGHWSKFYQMDSCWWGKWTSGIQFFFLFSVIYLGHTNTILLVGTGLISILSAALYVHFFFTTGIHLGPHEKLGSAEDKFHRNQMLVLVILTMLMGLFVVSLAWQQVLI